MPMRTASVARKTNETDIAVTLNLDGDGVHHIATPFPFLDHILSAFAKHGLFRGHAQVDGPCCS